MTDHQSPTSPSQEIVTKIKPSFSENVQKWVLIDNQLKRNHEQVIKLREYRTQLTKDIHQYIKTNHLENTSIGISDGELNLSEKRDYQPLTFTYVKSCLTTLIKDPSQVERIMVYLRENREIKTTPDIRRTYK
jgi:hypothetical protein